jgi:hypothetical protein
VFTRGAARRRTCAARAFLWLLLALTPPSPELAQACVTELSSQCMEAAKRGDFSSPQACYQAVGLVQPSVSSSRPSSGNAASFGVAAQPANANVWHSHHLMIIILLLMNLACLGGAMMAFVAVRRGWQNQRPAAFPAVAYLAPGAGKV